MTRISVLLPCRDSERTIRRTLESVKWADEIFVIDSFSSDKTLEICREYTDRIHQREYVNSAAQKNWAIPRCAHDWILQIDSDEALEPGLKDELLRAVADADPGIDCFRIPRKNYAYGAWIRSCGFYPDHQTRLFRKSAARFEEKSVHARISCPGAIGTLKGHLLHDDFKDIGSYLIKFERYMRYELEEMIKTGRAFRWRDLCLRPPLVFFRCYLLQGGWREGFPGLLQSYLVSHYVFMKYAKLWEHEWNRRKAA